MHEIALDALTLRALTWGDVEDADRPLAVLLHGFPDTAHTWRHLGPVLADAGYRVVAPFTRGYGPSDLAADDCYHVAALMHDALAVHAHLRGDDRAVLIGHDWGAITAGGIAALAEQPFARIAVLAVPPIGALAADRRGPIEAARLGAVQLTKSWYVLFHQLPVLAERLFDHYVPALWRRWSPGYDATTDLAHLRTSLDAPGRRSAVIDYYRAPRRPGRVPERYRPYLRTWTALPQHPLLVVHGREDGCMNHEYAEGAAAHLLAGSRLVQVEQAGHFLHLERPDVVHEAVLAYLGA